MNYAATYCALISKRLKNPISKNDCYCETHHIIPKSEGGLDESDNLVNLTAREHYVAHLLLARIYDDVKMYSAVTYMQTTRHNGRNFKFNSHLYQKLREEFGRKSSAAQKGKKRKWKFTPETLAKLSASQKGKQISAKHRENISKAKKGKPIAHFTKGFLSKETSKRNKGRHWFTNGEENGFCYECPEGFHIGLSDKTRMRMVKSSKHIGVSRIPNNETRKKMSMSHKGKKVPKITERQIGTHWWNNGFVESRGKQCPEGFVAGRLKKEVR